LNWLEKAVKERLPLTPEVEGYLLGRGGKPDTIRLMGLGEWIGLEEECPDPVFRQRYGSRGEKLEGFMVCPVITPRGSVIGINARSMGVKKVERYLIRQAAWNPIWETRPDTPEKLWAGGEAWIVEGLFDMFALEWYVPSQDAVLSSIRANMTAKHVEFLRRFGVRVNMVYDRDTTGRDGTTKALSVLKRAGIVCRDVPYRGGEDPGELWDRMGQGIARGFM